MDWLRLLRFIGVGLLVVAAGEFLIQVLGTGGISGYTTTLAIYVVLLIIAFFVGMLFDRLRLGDLWYFLIFAFLGLMIEWFPLGNAPWMNPYANQAGMFSWWGAVFLVPRIFTSPDTKLLTAVRRRIWITLLLYSVILLAVTIPASRDARIFFGAIIISVAFLILNFSYTRYFTRNDGRRWTYFLLFWLLLVLGVGQLLLQTG